MRGQWGGMAAAGGIYVIIKRPNGNLPLPSLHTRGRYTTKVGLYVGQEMLLWFNTLLSVREMGSIQF